MLVPIELVEVANQSSNVQIFAERQGDRPRDRELRPCSPHRIGNSASRRWLTHSKFSRGVLRPGGGSVAGSNSAFSR